MFFFYLSKKYDRIISNYGDSMVNDLKIIKKKYGEKFSKLCRDLFPSIIEENKLYEVLSSLFYENHFLYDDIIHNDMVLEFQKLVMNKIEKNNILLTETLKNPYELFKEKGYTLKECHTNDEILSYKKYYAKGEELCTFKADRLKTNRVFFAVKDNALEIKRKDNPLREDEYGVSVLSLQFTLDTNYLSIKNRYNHSVTNPDATYQNNLENINKGLTYSFEKYLGIKQSNIKEKFELPNYVKTTEGKYYKYNFEYNNIYYCANNIVIDNFKVKKLPKEKYILFDSYVLDLVNKKFKCYDPCRYDTAEEVIKNIKNIKIINNNENKDIYITCENNVKVYLKLDKFNKLIGIVLENVKRLYDDFLETSHFIKYFSSKDTIYVEDRLLIRCFDLEYINLPNCMVIGNGFAINAGKIKEVSLPKLKRVDYSFMSNAISLEKVDLPNVEYIGNSFLYYNNTLKEISMPNLKRVGYSFLGNNINSLEKCHLENIYFVDDNFLWCNTSLKEFYAPKLKVVGKDFMSLNENIKYLYLPNIEKIDDNFLLVNKSLKYLYIPNVLFIGKNFLNNNKALIDTLYMPNLLSFEENKVVK